MMHSGFFWYAVLSQAGLTRLIAGCLNVVEHGSLITIGAAPGDLGTTGTTGTMTFDADGELYSPGSMRDPAFESAAASARKETEDSFASLGGACLDREHPCWHSKELLLDTLQNQIFLYVNRPDISSKKKHAEYTKIRAGKLARRNMLSIRRYARVSGLTRRTRVTG